ncbi:ferric reductase like transmembrane component [Zalerion maritima]|uniref:ferric-chelate reductase (NADPH) n=1 Tax=Zalerion maritima TaxID=339359 RepID=A0AAD5WPY5_9PEZI|nr:ferric reductase like transmembrane component [Zalerion maritima]
MGWPYTIQTLSKEEKMLRHETIKWYAAIAQISVVLPVLLFLAFILFRYMYLAAVRKPKGDSKGRYDTLPSSPALKKSRTTTHARRAVVLRRMEWWLTSEVQIAGTEWGAWDQWVLGLIWGGWMLCLSVMGTGDDYLHLTKRLGAIAMSQFPFQYLMSLKSVSPLALIFRTSHERINRFHRVLGRIIYLLLILHSVLYLNYFVVVGKPHKLYSTVVLAGLACITLMSALLFTSLASVRAYSYRLFFIVHLGAAIAIPLLLFLHVPTHVVWFVTESLFVFSMDLIARKIDTFTAVASLERLPGTNLIKMVIPVPENRSERFVSPGQHVYLSIPPVSRPHDLKRGLLFEFLFNPFTISSYSPDSGELVLIARHRKGPLTGQLAQLVRDRNNTNRHSAKTTGIKLNIEGPYGSLVPKFDNIIQADRAILIAGGVGATFVLPIYAALRSRQDAKVRLVWAVRQASEATWAVLTTDAARNGISGSPGESLSPTSAAKSILDDPNVELYLTGNLLHSSNSNSPPPPPLHRGNSKRTSQPQSEPEGELEMDDGEDVELVGMLNNNSKRPDIHKIVNDTFKLGGEETVAFVVCGPRSMGRDVRRAVTPWVMRKGRKVVWHEEAFGG